MSDRSRGNRDPREGSGLAGTKGPTEENYRRDLQDIEAPVDDDGVVEPIAPAAAEADAVQEADEDGGIKDAVEPKGVKESVDNATDSERAGETEVVDLKSARKGRRAKGTPQEVAESQQARIVRAEQSEAKRREQYELAKKRFILKVHETRDAVSKLREQCRRDGKNEEEFEDEAKKLVHARAEDFDHSDRMQVMENLLKNVRITNADTAKRKFEFLVGLGMREHMRFWSRENYVHRFEKKAGKQMETALEEQRQQLESEYNEMDRVLAELDRESGVEEEQLQKAA